MLLEPRLYARRLSLVVDRGVKPELVDDVATLLLAARDADHAASPDLRDLPDHGTHRTCCGRNDDGLARLWPADVEETEVCGHARHAERAQVHG